MAKGRYVRKRRGKGGLVLLLIVTLLVVTGCVVGMFMVLNGDKPAATPQYSSSTGTMAVTETGESTTAATTVPMTTAPVTQPTEATTMPTEETTIPLEETTAPTEETTVPTLGADATLGQLVAQTALAQVGKPYQNGGNGPDGFDTTGFLFYCLQQNGLVTKRLKLKQLALEGTEVAKEDLQPGDVVFFWSSNEGQVEYAGIYVGDGKFVAARNEQNPVSEMDLNSNYFKTRYLTARRFANG